MATHAVGPFLLTRMLSGRMIETAKLRGGNGSRVVWVSSMISLGAPKGGLVWDDVEGGGQGGQPKVLEGGMDNYMQSKVASVFLAHEHAKRVGGDGVLSVVSFSQVHFNTEWCAWICAKDN